MAKIYGAVSDSIKQAWCRYFLASRLHDSIQVCLAVAGALYFIARTLIG